VGANSKRGMSVRFAQTRTPAVHLRVKPCDETRRWIGDEKFEVFFRFD